MFPVCVYLCKYCCSITLEKEMATHSSEELDMTERLHFSFSCIAEGNGKPLQYSCLENPRDGGVCWAAVYGVAELDTTKVT